MRVNANKLIGKIERLIPPSSAENWDNVGWQVGAASRVIDKVLVCLEVTEAVIDEAVERCSDLIIAHHPLIFKPLSAIDEATPKGRIIARMIKEDIGLYIMHTNYDHYPSGMAALVAQQLQLHAIAPLIDVDPQPLYKLVVYTPADALEAVSQAAFNAGAGHIGQYSDCGFSVAGTGSFKPLAGAEPSIGAVGQLSQVAEHRFETIVPAERRRAVIAAICEAHPYEEVAYDVYRTARSQAIYSLGKRGKLPRAMSIEDFSDYLKRQLSLHAVKLAGPADRIIEQVALIPGSGMAFVDQVAKRGVDAFITGDVKYHEAMEASHHQLLIADIGHFESEVIFGKGFAKQLRTIAEQHNYDLVIEAASSEQSPFRYW